MLIAEVILPLPLAGTFSYSIPGDFAGNCKPGFRVMVSFGKSKFLTGVIYQVKDEERVIDLKPILDTLDEAPTLLPYQLDFLRWMAGYYMCSLGEATNAALPSGFKLSSESIVALQPEIDADGLILSEEEQWLIRRLQEKDLILSAAERLLDSASSLKMIKNLQSRGVIQIVEKIKEKYNPRTEKRLRLSDDYLIESALDELLKQLEKRTKQIDVLVAYLNEINVLIDPILNRGGIAKKDLLNQGVSESSLKTLVKQNILIEWSAVVDRFAGDDRTKAEIPNLTDGQQLALHQIDQQLESKLVVLLKGVTGSGKTAIYMSMIKREIDQGKKVLYLLPEIALTTQIISRFRRVFGNRFGIFHSRFSDNERVEVWKKCLKGEFDFIIGVRSAVFLPLEDLSLVIVDEEHETSYKQQDPAPRYNARDAAIYLANLREAKVLLGSATPSIESYYNALEGKFGLVELNERFNQQPPPPIHLVDLSRERKKKTIKGNFSNRLLDDLEASKAKEEQAILFQNRRGYAPFLLCDNCSHSPKCPNCSVSLTYHIFKNMLVCHYCGYNENMYQTCDNCNQGTFRTIGTGTEKIEEELQILLPEVKVRRMDLDSTRSKYAYQDIIDAFEQGEIDVLVGTQIVSKGLDFDNVSLVGIFDADRMIHFPDFRSHERAFHLITQVAGRAGRKEIEGQVLVQTNDPEQRLLKQIQDDNYEGFFRDEIQERTNFRYPPFFRLIVITIRHKDKRVSLTGAEEMAYILRKDLGNLASTPIEPLVSKIRNYYRFQIVVRIPKEDLNLSGVKQFLMSTRDRLLALPSFKSIKLHFDVDPL